MSSDTTSVINSQQDDCEGLKLLERRVDSHARQLVELKNMMEINNTNTKEILDIVGLGKSFFKVLGWLGTVFKTLATIGTPVAAFIYWLKTGSK